jgi:hypothetical protein
LVDDIGCLTKLEELNLTGNPLTVVPEAIGECLSMEVLDMRFATNMFSCHLDGRFVAVAN